MNAKNKLFAYNTIATVGYYLIPQLLVLAGFPTLGWLLASFIATISVATLVLAIFVPRAALVTLAPQIGEQMGAFANPTFCAAFNLACLFAAALLGADELLMPALAATLVFGLFGSILTRMMMDQAKTELFAATLIRR